MNINRKDVEDLVNDMQTELGITITNEIEKRAYSFARKLNIQKNEKEGYVYTILTNRYEEELRSKI